MAICVSAEINMEDMVKLTIVSAQACALEIKLVIVERSGITQSLLLVGIGQSTQNVFRSACTIARLIIEFSSKYSSLEQFLFGLTSTMEI